MSIVTSEFNVGDRVVVTTGLLLYAGREGTVAILHPHGELSIRLHAPPFDGRLYLTRVDRVRKIPLDTTSPVCETDRQ
jgi:hypothetical protein